MTILVILIANGKWQSNSSDHRHLKIVGENQIIPEMQAVYVEGANGTEEKLPLPLEVIQIEVNNRSAFQVWQRFSSRVLFFMWVCIDYRHFEERRQRLFSLGTPEMNKL